MRRVRRVRGMWRLRVLRGGRQGERESQRRTSEQQRQLPKHVHPPCFLVSVVPVVSAARHRHVFAVFSGCKKCGDAVEVVARFTAVKAPERTVRWMLALCGVALLFPAASLASPPPVKSKPPGKEPHGQPVSARGIVQSVTPKNVVLKELDGTT